MKALFAVLAVVAALGVVGSFDYEDAQNQEMLYCDNVKAGTWPDYEGTYDEVCAKTHGPKKVVKNFR